MKVEIQKSQLKGTIVAPPSKSLAHRLLICAALAGESTVCNLAFSEDILATLDCLKALGFSCAIKDNAATFKGREKISNPVLNCRESASTLRFFIPLCSVLAEEATLTGTKKLLSRPLSVYEKIFAEQKLFFHNDGAEVKIQGRLSSGVYAVPGDVSSQFVSGLLFALPLLEKDSTLTLIPPVESRSYIKLTLEALATFGVEIKTPDENTFFIPGKQKYQPRNVKVEGDYSNSAFFAALKALGHEIEIQGLNNKSSQGDKAYETLLPLLEQGKPKIDLSDCPDLGPVLFAFAAAKNGALFTGTRRLRIKESDRAEAMAQELRKFGVKVEVQEDSVAIESRGFSAPKEELNSHNDHRIAMALSVLATETGGVINGAEAVAKSFPDFFDRIIALNAKVINK